MIQEEGGKEDRERDEANTKRKLRAGSERERMEGGKERKDQEKDGKRLCTMRMKKKRGKQRKGRKEGGRKGRTG